MGAAAEKPITVQESSRERVVFTWKLSSYSASTVRADNGAATELSSPDANVEIGAVGETIVPGRSFHVGLPPGGRATVSVVPLEVATRPLQHPPTRRDSSANPELYRTIQFDQPWVSRGAPARFGRLGAAAYVLRPFVWDEAAGVLRVLKRARVEVRFSGETHAYAPPSGGPYEPVLRRLLLNYDIARMWRTPAVSSSLRKAARDEYPLRPSRTLAWFEIGDGHSGLNETTTNENGLVRISGQSITAVLGNNLAIERVALWAAQMGELPWSPPEPAEVPSRLVRIPVMRFDVDRKSVV